MMFAHPFLFWTLFVALFIVGFMLGSVFGVRGIAPRIIRGWQPEPGEKPPLPTTGSGVRKP